MPNEQRTTEPTEEHSNERLERRLREAMAEDIANADVRQELEERMAASYLGQAENAAPAESMLQRMQRPVRQRQERESEQTRPEYPEHIHILPRPSPRAIAQARRQQEQASSQSVQADSPFIHPDTFNTPTIPEVGMGATVKLWDESCFAATIISVNRNKSRLTVKRDTSIMCFNHGLQFGFRYEPNPAGLEITFTKRRNGAWIRERQYFGDGKNELIIGRRAEVFLFVVENQS